MFYATLKERFIDIIREHRIAETKIIVTGKTLTPEEAIGKPKRRDFPLFKGKEKMIQAEFEKAYGQAFTDMPGYFYGTLREIAEHPLKTNFDRAVLIASINAVCNHSGLTKGTIHCKDEEPERCAEEFVHYIKEGFGNPKILLVGLQPAMLERFSRHFVLRALDLDPDNIGRKKAGLMIEDGLLNLKEAIRWCDLVVATGSTIVNATLPDFLTEKPVIFFGVTIAGPAKIMNLRRFCPYAH